MKPLKALFLMGALLTGAEAREPGRPAREPVQFNRDIRPILTENCLRCHGPDEKKRKADLRLDTREGALAVIVPGNLQKSGLWKHVSSTDPEVIMPPPKSGKKLTVAQIALLKRWIEEGAEWQGHWSFIPPQRSDVKASIDSFILARLKKEGLKPSPEADRITLARRVTLDLTGLPPTPQEVDAFAADRSADAYEKLVDRLLASPRYGEHMARFWLDLARYGDTHGLHLDNYREMWHFREWVVRAFNDNLPYDRFAMEQLAGDLLPDATLEQQIASGFNRCHVTTSEGGSIEEEVYCRNVFDRVETFSQVFMSLTLTCARCHDHKYDPITQKDYYRLFAFFNSLDGSELDGNKKDPEPVIKVPEPAVREELANLRKEAGTIDARFDAPLPEVDAAQPRWETDMVARFKAQWAPLDPEGFKALGEASLAEGKDRSVRAGDHKLVYEITARTVAPGVRAIRLEVLPTDPPPPEGTPESFTLSEVEAEVIPSEPPRRIAFRTAVSSVSGARNLVDGSGKTGWTGDARTEPAAVLIAAEPFDLKEGVSLRLRLIHQGAHARQPAGRFRFSLSTDGELLKGATPSTVGPWHFGADPAVDPAKWTEKREFADGQPHDLPPGTWLTRVITAPTPRKVTFAMGSDDGLKVWFNGSVVLAKDAPRKFKAAEDKVAVTLEPGENRLLVKIAGARFSFEIAAEEAADLFRDVAEALSTEAAKRSDAQKALLRTHYRRDNWPEWRPLSARRAQLRGREKEILDASPTTLVFRERAQPREAYLLKRGEYDKRGEKVGRETPGALPPLAEDLPWDRLGLAKWLLDPEHPLTARVAVNRFWQQCFGTGLVKTSEDFGIQGEPPSHPELLDHLALEFAEDGWDVKKFMRRLVISSTYRQASRSTPELTRRDPENRLLARGPRFRLDAEMLRDQALYVSGLMVEKLGGPSVKPPQPEGLWEAVGYSGSNTARFTRDVGAERVFRRSLYTFWKRTSPPPQMTSFDAPSRESCIARRERTNTPLQALLLMNEPQYVEAARSLAQRAMKEGGSAPAVWMFRTAVARPPSAKDLADLVEAFGGFREGYARKPEAAKKLVESGDTKRDPALDPVELAAWTLVANIILNLDETLTKR